MPPPATTDRYKWIALSNTTLGVLMVTINQSILLIALPDIFRGIRIDPLAPGNTNYLLWMILSFLIVTAVLVVSGVDRETAERALRQSDRTHAEYVRHFYGARLDDPSLYHLALDSTAIPLDACVDVIAEVATGWRARR